MGAAFCAATHVNFTGQMSPTGRNADLLLGFNSPGHTAIREADMGALMLKCPTTGRVFSTGILADEETFKQLPDTVTKATCPHCG